MAEMKKGAWVAGLLVLASVVAAVKFFMPSKSDESVQPKTSAGDATAKPTPSNEPAKTTAAPATGATKEAKVVTHKTSYKNPAGEDEVGFTLYVDSTSMVVDAKTDILAVHDISKKRQAAFAEGFPAAVKGKKLSELTAIDRVGGSSLTTAAFNGALAQLKSQI